MLEEEHRLYREVGSDYFWLSGKRNLIWALLQTCPGKDRLEGPLLDLGCGPGYAFEELRRHGPVFGLDFSAEALRTCRQRCTTTAVEAQLMRGRADQLPCLDNSLQLVVSLDLLEHLENDDAVLQECRRVLRHSGWLVLSVPAFPWLWGDHDTRFGHRRRYTVPALKEKLCRAGFKPLKVTYVQALFVVPLWFFRRVKQLLPKPVRPESDFMKVTPAINRWLKNLIVWEALCLRRWNLPWGVSIVAICQKP